jgi:hypothetical protein
LLEVDLFHDVVPRRVLGEFFRHSPNFLLHRTHANTSPRLHIKPEKDRRIWELLGLQIQCH